MKYVFIWIFKPIGWVLENVIGYTVIFLALLAVKISQGWCWFWHAGHRWIEIVPEAKYKVCRRCRIIEEYDANS